jgi:hypothetical protein
MATVNLLPHQRNRLYRYHQPPSRTTHDTRDRARHRKLASTQERKLSTSFLIIESLVQVFINNLFLVAVAYPLLAFELLTSQQVLGFGITPLIFNFMWQFYTIKPTEKIRFFLVPFELPIRYLPWIYLIILPVIDHPMFPNIVYCILGLYQHCFGCRLLPLPFAAYACLDKCMPNSVKSLQCYKEVKFIEKDLRAVSAKGFCDLEYAGEEESLNESRMQQETGTTSSISNQQPSYKNHWASKMEEGN